MRNIDYIFIDSDGQNGDGKSISHMVPNFRFHYIVNRWNDSGNPVANPTDISLTAHIIRGPIYDPDKYNKSSIFVRYCGSLLPAYCPSDSDTEIQTIMAQRATLIQLLLHLRNQFPDAKILGLSEIDGRELYCKNITVSEVMNVLRRELSEH